MILFSMLLLASCGQVKNDDPEKNVVENSIAKAEMTAPVEFDSVAYTLLQNNCMACHNAVGKTHDQLIAPPIIAVKRRYLKASDGRDDFIENMTAWATDPKEENALMKGAVDKFKVMPNLGYKETDMRKVAAFMYDNEMEKPEWFEEHFNEMHPDGKGKGRNGNN